MKINYIHKQIDITLSSTIFLNISQRLISVNDDDSLRCSGCSFEISLAHPLVEIAFFLLKTIKLPPLRGNPLLGNPRREVEGKVRSGCKWP